MSSNPGAPSAFSTRRPAVGATRRLFADVPSEARPYAVRMRDGVRLATDVYLPAHGRRWPTLLSRLPYDKAGDECFMPQIAQWFTERGYAVVVQDVRGKIRSGGALEPFRAEVADGYDTLDWITRQPWCAGPVGMFGDSYYGWTQWAAAASGHQALRAIAPRVTSSDIGDITSRSGILSLEVTALWALETWVDEYLYDYDGTPDWSIRPLCDVIPTALGGRRSAFLDTVLTGGLDTSARLPIRGDVPALHLGGWWDIAQRGQFATWRTARRAGKAPQFLTIDAVDHGWNALWPTKEPYLDSYLGPMHAFFDYFVAETRAYDVPSVRWHLANASWCEAEDWPPVGSRPFDWYLVGADGNRGELRSAPDERRQVLSWVQEPDDLVPSLAHAYHPLIEPTDDAVLADRPDVLTFDTEPAARPLDLAGPASLTVETTSTSDGARIMASLGDVAPDGTVLRVADGVAAVSGERVEVDLGDAGYRLRTGHALRLSVSASEFPRYLPDTGTGENPWTARKFIATEQQIVIGGTQAARLRCHVMEVTGGDA
ncbi:MAG: CocE/NonD family hydrolase [Actinomycetia bacterium]|nr:CocE/NonD family hydrolase [Actinomycetes bacterium]